MKNQMFYFSVSDTLQKVNKNSSFYKTAMKQALFNPIQNSSNFRILKMSSLSFDPNLVETRQLQKIDSAFFIGSFQFSRVIFDKGGKRALVFMFSEDTPFLFPIVELEKIDEEWKIK